MTLQGRVGVVTGGGRGIGMHIARALAREGMDLVLAARTEQQLEAVRAGIGKDFGARCLAQRTDVSRPGEVAALIERARRDPGALHVLVSNPGSSRAICSCGDG